MKILTSAEMHEVDRQTRDRYGIHTLTLMENAGTRVADFLVAKFPNLARQRIVIFCGKGNNGGDGLVVARKLSEHGIRPVVIVCDVPAPVGSDAAINLKRWRDVGGEIKSARTVEDWEAAKQCLDGTHVIVDAFLGTGLRGPAEGVYRPVIADINRHATEAVVVSVDLPSGLSADSGHVPGPAVTADFTITFTAPKFGLIMYPAAWQVGRLQVAHIGSPWALIEEIGAGDLRWLEPQEFRALSFRRKPASHKGDYGHALIIAGSRGKTGAAVLAGWSALRAGAGLVTVATAHSELHTVATPIPELMTEPLESTDAGSISLRSFEFNRFKDLLRGKNIIAMGPGLGLQPETQQFIRTVVEESPLPIILDADGLNAFAGQAIALKRRESPRLAITPHPGEMARLLESTTQEVQAMRLDAARRAAAEWDAFVILKGYRTAIAAPDGHLWINSPGNPGMATGGTGDVLTGILAGLTAQFGHELWPSVLGLGVYLHGLAGDLAAAEVGEAPLIASDLIRFFPRAYEQTVAELDRA